MRIKNIKFKWVYTESRTLFMLYSVMKVSIPLICIFFYFAFWWTYKLELLPGLHGDEAWSGIKALHFNTINEVDQLTGMNYYTGIFQAVSAKIAFSHFSPGVMQMRLIGVLFNLLSLGLIWRCLVLEYSYKSAGVFLIIIAQSGLYMTTPRVAWEVNSFTLFFLSIAFTAILRIKLYPNRKNPVWIVVFLAANLLGTYNHVIFSCISISALAGLVLWTYYFNSVKYINLIILLSINLANMVITYLCMRNLNAFILDFIGSTCILIVIGLLLEFRLYKSLIEQKSFINLNGNRKTIKVLLIAFVLIFCVLHGTAFFQTISSYKILVQTYSFEAPIIVQGLFYSCGIVFLIILSKSLWKDFISSANSALIFIILTYLGLFCLYTQDCSFRYYLALYIGVCIYIASKASRSERHYKKFALLFGVGFLILNGCLIHIFFLKSKPLRAIDFNIGVVKVETSAHFLPKQPLLNFLEENEIGSINILSDDPYFILEPLKFYKLIKPWKENKENRALIDYDYNSYKSGFMLYKE